MKNKNILFPNNSIPLDISKINTLAVVAAMGSGWSNGVFTLTANILDFLRKNNKTQKKNLIIYDNRLLFNSEINSKIVIPVQKEFKAGLLDNMIEKSLAEDEHIFLLVVEIKDSVHREQFQQFLELVKKYKGNLKAHFIFTTNRLIPNDQPVLDSLIKGSDCVIFFNTVGKNDCRFYLGQDCEGAFNKAGDMVIKQGDKITKTHGNKFDEEDMSEYLKHYN